MGLSPFALLISSTNSPFIAVPMCWISVFIDFVLHIVWELMKKTWLRVYSHRASRLVLALPRANVAAWKNYVRVFPKVHHWCTNRTRVKDPSVSTWELAQLDRHKTGETTVIGSRVQALLEFTFLLILFCSNTILASLPKKKLSSSVVDVRGRPGTCPPLAQNFLDSMQFFWNFDKITLVPPWRSVPPSYRESWVRPWFWWE